MELFANDQDRPEKMALTIGEPLLEEMDAYAGYILTREIPETDAPRR